MTGGFHIDEPGLYFDAPCDGHFAAPCAKPLKEALVLVFMGEPGLPEVVIAWKIETKHGEIWCRAMVDAWCPSLMMAVDLKSTTDASSEAAAKKIERDGIDTQAAWYSRGLGHLIG